MITTHFARLLCLCSLGAPLTFAAQDSFELYRPLQAESVRFERETRLRDLYADASDSGRAAVLALFEADRSSGHVAWLPALSTFASAERVLGGESTQVGPNLNENFLASLDVRVSPGFFAVREEGNGEAITVYVESCFQSAIPREMVIGLDWVSPTGVRFRARQESFTDREFGEGLEFYIRPPVSEASDWTLAPTLTIGDNELRRDGVTVSCVNAVDSAREQLQAGGQGSLVLPQRALWRDWNHLRDFGVRSTAAATLPERLGHFGLAGGVEWNHAYRWIRFGEESDLGAWGIAPESKPQSAVVILTDGRRDETAVFAGTLESRWAKFAADRSTLVLTTSYSDKSEDAARLDALIGALRDQGVDRIGFVAFGDTSVFLPAHLRRLPAELVDRLLICSSATVANGVRLQFAAPALGIAYGHSEDSIQRQEPDALSAGEERWFVKRRGPAFLTEIEVPALLSRFMDGSL